MNKILVIADTTEGEQKAIKTACALAKSLGASLHIVHFCYVSPRELEDNPEAIKRQVIESVSAQSGALLKELIPEDISYTHAVEWVKYIHVWVQSYERLEKPVLVVKSGHRSEHLFYKSTDNLLIRECESPLYLVGEQKWKGVNGVLASIDLGTKSSTKLNLNEKVIRQAQEFSTALSVPLSICYVPVVTPLLQELGVQTLEQAESNLSEQLSDASKSLVENNGMNLEQLIVRAGQPHKVIPEIAADLNAEIVVVGTQGRSGLSAGVIGNTAESILSLLKTDVLVVR